MAAKLTAVLGVCKRRGRWRVAGQTKALVLFGHCYIDYREAYADPDLDKMKLSVLCLFGNATFVVPEGSDIQPSVVSLLASTAFDVPQIDIEPSLPTLVIESTTLFGRCRVVTSVPGEEDRLIPDGDASPETPISTTVDRIGPMPTGDVKVPIGDVKLPPLEAVAKALLAEPSMTNGPEWERAAEEDRGVETAPETPTPTRPKVEVAMPDHELPEAA